MWYALRVARVVVCIIVCLVVGAVWCGLGCVVLCDVNRVSYHVVLWVSVVVWCRVCHTVQCRAVCCCAVLYCVPMCCVELCGGVVVWWCVVRRVCEELWGCGVVMLWCVWCCGGAVLRC